MENITIAPFYIGQEVVANCNHSQSAFKKGDEFKVTSIEFRCCRWVITVGIKSTLPKWRCTHCSHVRKSGIEWAFFANRFSPKIEIGEFISMKQLVEEKLE